MGMDSVDENQREKKLRRWILCKYYLYILLDIFLIHMTRMLHNFYFNNNNFIHANVYYIQFYITFQHFYDVPGGIGCCGSGPHMGQGYPSWKFMSIGCLCL